MSDSSVGRAARIRVASSSATSDGFHRAGLTVQRSRRVFWVGVCCPGVSGSGWGECLEWIALRRSISWRGPTVGIVGRSSSVTVSPSRKVDSNSFQELNGCGGEAELGAATPDGFGAVVAEGPDRAAAAVDGGPVRRFGFGPGPVQVANDSQDQTRVAGEPFIMRQSYEVQHC